MHLNLNLSHQVDTGKMDAGNLVQHVERDMEATLWPLYETTYWPEDGNETFGNQFQQPDWQVGEQQDQRGDWFETEPDPSYKAKQGSVPRRLLKY